MTLTVFLLLALFGIKHFIADFVMQYDYMVRDKGIYGAEGGLHHAATHACWTFLILIPFIRSPEQLLILPLVDFIAHYHIDWVKQQVNQGYTYSDRMWWVWLGVDQALNYLTYVGIIYYVTVS
jgi:hypothetical protein